MYCCNFCALSFFLVKPENVQLTTSAANNKACQGGSISFNCSADANPSVTSYQLFENDTAILATNTSGMWSRNLTNGGVFIYKCVANNTLGSAYSTSVTVTVNGNFFYCFIVRILLLILFISLTNCAVFEKYPIDKKG